MSTKAICPGCDSYTSTVHAAFSNGRPCPFCGLSASAAAEIEAVRERRGDEKLKADLEAALLRAGKAESEVRVLKYRLGQVESALSRVTEALKADPPQY